MKPTFNELLFGGAEVVADTLYHSSEEMTDLVPALINALRRIAVLERQVQQLNAKVETKVYG